MSTKTKTTWKVWDGKLVKKIEAQTKAATRNQTKSTVKKATTSPAQPVESMSFTQFCETVFPDIKFSKNFIDTWAWLEYPKPVKPNETKPYIVPVSPMSGFEHYPIFQKVFLPRQTKPPVNTDIVAFDVTYKMDLHDLVLKPEFLDVIENPTDEMKMFAQIGRQQEANAYLSSLQFRQTFQKRTT